MTGVVGKWRFGYGVPFTELGIHADMVSRLEDLGRVVLHRDEFGELHVSLSMISVMIGSVYLLDAPTAACRVLSRGNNNTLPTFLPSVPIGGRRLARSGWPFEGRRLSKWRAEDLSGKQSSDALVPYCSSARGECVRQRNPNEQALHAKHLLRLLSVDVITGACETHLPYGCRRG